MMGRLLSGSPGDLRTTTSCSAPSSAGRRPRAPCRREGRRQRERLLLERERGPPRSVTLDGVYRPVVGTSPRCRRADPAAGASRVAGPTWVAGFEKGSNGAVGARQRARLTPPGSKYPLVGGLLQGAPAC